MKIKIGLILISGLFFSSVNIAQEKNRTHLKCHLQLEDKSDIVHYFVNTESSNEGFIAGLPELPVFMADGITEQKIVTVYECVETKNNFKGKEAIALEKRTAF